MCLKFGDLYCFPDILDCTWYLKEVPILFANMGRKQLCLNHERLPSAEVRLSSDKVWRDKKEWANGFLCSRAAHKELMTLCMHPSSKNSENYPTIVDDPYNCSGCTNWPNVPIPPISGFHLQEIRTYKMLCDALDTSLTGFVCQSSITNPADVWEKVGKGRQML